MRVVDKRDLLDRRRFLTRSTGAAGLLAASPMLSGAAQAAIALKTGPASAAPTLVRMARDLYPHDRLPDSAYETAVATIDAQFAGNPTPGVTMADGVRALDEAAQAHHGRAYLAIEAEADRVSVLRAMEAAASPFFKAMRASMITALYNQPELWPRFGYEGSSAEMGGYLHRGFDDLNWLPA